MSEQPKKTIDPPEEEILATMAEISRGISALLPLEELMGRIVDFAARFVECQIFSIFLADEAQRRLRLRYLKGSAHDALFKEIDYGSGLVGTAAATREAVRVADVSKDPRYIAAVEGVRSELSIPLISRNHLVGVLDIQSSQLDYFRPSHQKILVLVASQLAVALDNAHLYEKLGAESEIMETLHEISKDVASILDLEQLLRKVGEMLHRVMRFDIFSIMLVDEEEQMLKTRLSVKYNRDAVEKSAMPLGKGLAGTAISRKKPLVVNDVSRDPRYIPVNPETRSEMVVPLVYKERVIGAFDLQSSELHYFTPLHEKALSTLASHVAVAIENARLYERVVAAEARLDREMKIAQEIQYNLIPDKFPELKGVRFWAEYKPARILGGDLYDFFKYEEQTVAMAIGDVSGKGAPAALYGALVSGMLRTRANRKYPPAEMLRLVNLSLRQRAIEGRFMTLCFAIYDAEKRLLQISNSGSPPPLLCRNGEAEFLNVEGFPLGMFDKAEYQEREVAIQPGDAVVFYTDGLIEARDLRGEEFGLERLKAAVEKYYHLQPNRMIEKIFSQIEKFTLDNRKYDDRTMLVLKAEADST